MAFNVGASDGVEYGSFASSKTVYAFNSLQRTPEVVEAANSCVWMFPALVDPASIVSSAELVAVMDGLARAQSVSLVTVRGETPLPCNPRQRWATNSTSWFLRPSPTFRNERCCADGNNDTGIRRHFEPKSV